MKAAVFHEFGDTGVVRIEEVPTPELGPGQVLLSVRAAALNHLDLWVRRGLPIETTMPHIGGSDIAGVVTALGPGVDRVRVGQHVVVDPSLGCGECPGCRSGEPSLCERYRILGEHTNGGLAEYVAVPAANLHAVPDGYDLTRAAAAPLVFATAWRGLVHRGRLRAGESVLITGASGGVGSAAVQIARHVGARVYAVTRGDYVAAVLSLGAARVYDRERVDYSREVWRETDRHGVDLVFDGVGAATWSGNMRVLARGGRLVTYGATTGPRAEIDIRRVFWRQLEIIGTTMANPVEFREVMDLVFTGELAPVVDVVWPLEQARDAHDRLERGEHFGKIVLTP